MQALKIWQVFSLVSLAIFTGAFLFIAIVIVPFWLSSEPNYFLEWFEVNFLRFPTLMIPLNLIAFVTTFITLIISWKSKANTKIIWSMATIVIFLASITYPIYFASANALFLNKTIELSLVMPEIITWSNWNWLRTTLTFIALIFAVIGVYKFKEE
ncbi:MAG: hypothetical protein ACRC80_33910 [Waterburya sp.]